MKVYVKGGEQLSYSTDNTSFLQSSQGSYMYIGLPSNTTAYQGVALFDTTTYELTKVISAVHFIPEVTQVHIHPTHTHLSSGKKKQIYSVQNGFMCIEHTGNGIINIEFDVRQIYDMNTQGRIHSCEIRKINEHYELYVTCKEKSFVIISTDPFILCNNWVSTQTPFDFERGGSGEWWSFHGAQISLTKGNKLIISDHLHLSKAREQIYLDWVYEETFEKNLVLTYATSSLQGLITKTRHGESAILAGLPWFFQIWSRDEAISVGGLISLGKYELAKHILLRQIQIILPNGTIPNRVPHSDIGSIDGMGWAFLRLHQLYVKNPDSYTQEELIFVYEQLLSSLSRLPTKDYLVYNDSQETWMDTKGSTNDTRKGACIEIQALVLRMRVFAIELEKKMNLGQQKSMQEQFNKQIAKVREIFYDPQNIILADRFENNVDITVRPNALLAAYIFPDLLSPAEWEQVGEKMISILKTSWGGLKTIDPAHKLYQDTHTGKNDDSYHRGDSWYFVNNLCALGLVQISNNFNTVAKEILDASTHDLFFEGIIGHSSEISHAKKQQALGCLAQAWSSATLVELSVFLEQHFARQ